MCWNFGSHVSSLGVLNKHAQLNFLHRHVRHQCNASFQSAVNDCSPIVTSAYLITEGVNFRIWAPEHVYFTCVYLAGLSLSSRPRSLFHSAFSTNPIINSRKSLWCLRVNSLQHARSSADCDTSRLFPFARSVMRTRMTLIVDGHCVSWTGLGGLVLTARKQNSSNRYVKVVSY